MESTDEKRISRKLRREKAIESVVDWYHATHGFADEIANAQVRLSREVLTIEREKPRNVQGGGGAVFYGLQLEVERLKDACDNFLKHVAEAKKEYDTVENEFWQDFIKS